MDEPKPIVTCRKVNRYFACGKGYATERQAWTAAARKCLKNIVRYRAQQIENRACCICGGRGEVHRAPCYVCNETGKEWPSPNTVFEVYAEMFPHDEEFLCSYYGGGVCAGQGEELDPFNGSVTDPGTPKYSWCKTAYRAWIAAKIIELKNQPALMVAD